MTRGAWGYRLNNKDTIFINNSDCYPSGLGEEVVKTIQETSTEDMIAAAKKSKSDDIHFLHDSMWCDWAYIINLDKNVLEVYTGSNRNPKAPGRYASKNFNLTFKSNYCGIALIKVIPLNKVSIRTMDRIENGKYKIPKQPKSKEKDDYGLKLCNKKRSKFIVIRKNKYAEHNKLFVLFAKIYLRNFKQGKTKEIINGKKIEIENIDFENCSSYKSKRKLIFIKGLLNENI